MKREELDTLLKELVTPETTAERGLEIIKAIQDDKDNSLAKYDELVTRTDKLQNEYNDLKKTKVDDFFNKGTDFEPPKETEDTSNPNEEPEPLPNYDDLVSEMIGE